MAVVAVDEVVPLEGPHLDKVEEAHPVVASHTAAVAVGAVVDLVDVVDASCVEAVGLDLVLDAAVHAVGVVHAAACVEVARPCDAVVGTAYAAVEASLGHQEDHLDNLRAACRDVDHVQDEVVDKALEAYQGEEGPSFLEEAFLCPCLYQEEAAEGKINGSR